MKPIRLETSCVAILFGAAVLALSACPPMEDPGVTPDGGGTSIPEPVQNGCTRDAQCSGATPKCIVSTGTCVACLPGDTSSCAQGERCAANFECVRGCTVGAQCASGTCLPSGDCEQCQQNEECATGKTCGGGTCTAPCTNDSTCNGQTCCSGACTDLAKDIRNCGACNVACSATQFCGGTACEPVQVAKVCELDKVAVILNGAADDEAAGQAIGAGLQATCGATVRTVSQNDTGVLDPTGKPVGAADELVVAAGGSFFHKVVRYLETSGASGVISSETDTTLTLTRRSGGAVVSVPRAQVNAGHDYLVIETIREPTKGILTVVVWAFEGTGTRAAGWYFVNQVLPNRAAQTQRWYVVEWTDNGNGAADAGDTFTLLASGQ